ncbi:CoxF protein [Novosphingobium flavum]|uniref:CoxF protein n=1 Tax=Novosphingobium flavum TaxID=1778672 RepID=A0A7X1FRT7_9SPHN|nr:CoxF protein [Novosphingobium flavum]MBC2665796.1 CoxF protein [Novosphingobium flavum]
MTDTPDPESPEYMERRKQVIRQRNVATALVLGFFVVLFFAITIVKMKI